ncbi:hypothetical protein TIFTF001_033814 [Ficus carica]|uniref:Uncharacterized protein n=1 Tax=Ficus carica TaxID=3494 RepID=A0AA88DYU6_FICCA|nr:hypothetical protein TIFTF001_033814 [Ficus carica]
MLLCFPCPHQNGSHATRAIETPPHLSRRSTTATQALEPPAPEPSISHRHASRPHAS